MILRKYRWYKGSVKLKEAYYLKLDSYQMYFLQDSPKNRKALLNFREAALILEIKHDYQTPLWLGSIP